MKFIENIKNKTLTDYEQDVKNLLNDNEALNIFNFLISENNKHAAVFYSGDWLNRRKPVFEMYILSVFYKTQYKYNRQKIDESFLIIVSDKNKREELINKIERCFYDYHFFNKYCYISVFKDRIILKDNENFFQIFYIFTVEEIGLSVDNICVFEHATYFGDGNREMLLEKLQICNNTNITFLTPIDQKITLYPPYIPLTSTRHSSLLLTYLNFIFKSEFKIYVKSSTILEYKNCIEFPDYVKYFKDFITTEELLEIL
jgi:hypothetical protein